MGFFNDEENIKILQENIEQETNDMFKPGYSLGSPLFYNTELNKFILFREDAKISDIDKNKFIFLGIVLEQMEDYTFIIMYKNVLNSDPECIKLGSSNDAGSIVTGIFKDYCKRFKKKLPNEYSFIRKNINFILPSNRHMDLIYNNQNTIINKLTELNSKEKANTFKARLTYNKIFCNVGGYTVIWHTPTKASPNFYDSIKPFTMGYFLPIFVLNINDVNFHG